MFIELINSENPVSNSIIVTKFVLFNILNKMRIKENIASEFTEFSVNYTRDMIACVPHYLESMSGFTKDLPDAFVPKKILDLGCGNGNTTAEMLKRFPNAEYELVDASQKMIDLCQNRFAGYNMLFTNSYFKDFIFKHDNYDMVTAGFSLHHCDSEEKKDIFRNVCRSLKTGGIFGISDLMINKSSAEHSQLLKEWKSFVMKSFPDDEKWEWLMEHYDEFDKPDNYEDHIQWLKEAGFAKLNIVFQQDYWVHLRATK